MTIRIRELTINATIGDKTSSDSHLSQSKQNPSKQENGSHFVEDELKSRRER